MRVIVEESADIALSTERLNMGRSHEIRMDTTERDGGPASDCLRGVGTDGALPHLAGITELEFDCRVHRLPELLQQDPHSLLM